jgi:hypothetical protein
MSPSRSLVTLTLLAGAVVACAKDSPDAPPKTAADSALAIAKGLGGVVGGILKMAEKQEELDKSNPYANLKDPCVLVSRAEAEKVVGPLMADPYRVGGDKKPLPTGSACLYRAASGQSIKIEPTYSGGQMAMKMFRMTGGLTNQVMIDESGQADTLEGDWDDVRVDFGMLHALKGDVMIEVDANSSKAGAFGAGELANIAIKRLPHPLDYDGAKAAERAPGPLVAPRDPCSLVTKEEAAAILGPLVGEPTSSSSGCTFPIKNPLGPLANGPMPVVLQIEWSGGYEALANAKRSTATVMQKVGGNLEMAQGQAGGPGGDKVERKGVGEQAAPVDSDLEKMRHIMGALGASTEKGSLQLKTDTTSLKGPWDEAAILAGISFIAVKKDVSMAMDLRLLGEDKAIALVTKAMGRI